MTQAIIVFLLQVQHHGICPVIKRMLSDLTLSICSVQLPSQQLSNSLIADCNVQIQNTQFCKEKSGAGTASQREALLKELAAAYDAFSELKEHLSEGAKFYNDLTQVM